MNLPSDTPRLPKWVFIAGYVALLVTAWLIWDNAAHPTAGLALISTVTCVALAAVLIAVPFVADYANRQDEALDNRQRSLQALSVTVAAAAEQVSIAATGLQGIAEAAQENFSKFERLSKGIEEKIAELDSRLAATKKDDGEAAARYEAAAKKVAKSAGEFEAAAAKAASAIEAVRAAAAAAPLEPAPVIASRITAIRPAVRSSDHPFDESGGAQTPPADEPLSAPVPERPDPQPAPVPAPAETANPQAQAEPAAPPPSPRKRSPRKPPAAPVPEPAVDPSPEEPVHAPAAEVSEPAVSADGATRIVVTAYIGIGNRLFIRGDGPGLSWDRGVPLSFVSIGKWRWETSDASAAVRFRLYKNDEAECSALGERSIAPGAQQELTASF